jgi:hypothetical protein
MLVLLLSQKRQLLTPLHIQHAKHRRRAQLASIRRVIAISCCFVVLVQPFIIQNSLSWGKTHLFFPMARSASSSVAHSTSASPDGRPEQMGTSSLGQVPQHLPPLLGSFNDHSVRKWNMNARCLSLGRILHRGRYQRSMAQFPKFECLAPSVDATGRGINFSRLQSITLAWASVPYSIL